MKGSILIITLIFIAATGIIASFLFESTFLQLKMTAAFKQHRERWQAADKALRERENLLELTGQCALPECELIAFIPDEWYQQEITGVSYYRLHGSVSSTYARREHPAHRLFFENPYFAGIELHHYSFFPVVGSDPKGEGTRVYTTIPTQEGTMIQAIQVLSYSLSKIVYQLEEGTLLGTPLLWHEYLIVEKPLEHKIVIYHAHTGEKIQETRLTSELPSRDYPMCSLTPRVFVRNTRERKRKIIVPQSQVVWSAEIDLDFERLGRRTETALL